MYISIIIYYRLKSYSSDVISENIILKYTLTFIDSLGKLSVWIGDIGGINLKKFKIIVHINTNISKGIVITIAMDCTFLLDQCSSLSLIINRYSGGPCSCIMGQ